ncbi:transcription factor bHLH113 isoform X2 [Abrus precatorius]|uniref:Transcription factor bHLH113 isoform X2 n=1 Tax=Abrus precatorius TaxID=3816 RepID=A0A8B8MGV2_ABRPR|nr:transcription factor bHLH113 isoform X2 [Abrus precatorius]
METKEEFAVVDHLTTPAGTSFSQLLFGDDDDENALGLGVDHTYNLTHSPLFSIHKAPKMLSFANEGDVLLPETNVTPQKSVITSSDSSSASSCNYANTAFTTSLPKSNNLQKKRNGSGHEPVVKPGMGGQKQPKKIKEENPTSSLHAKRKEKLGERIAALQQLVSPFGKTDTASVLHEAMGYIRFLHDQVQVLCTPYLQSLPSSYNQRQHGDGDNNEEEVNKDLRSRGLCLIPVGCTIHVAGSNGADFWSPAAIGNNVSPSAKQ